MLPKRKTTHFQGSFITWWDTTKPLPKRGKQIILEVGEFSLKLKECDFFLPSFFFYWAQLLWCILYKISATLLRNSTCHDEKEDFRTDPEWCGRACVYLPTGFLHCVKQISILFKHSEDFSDQYQANLFAYIDLDQISLMNSSPVLQTVISETMFNFAFPKILYCIPQSNNNAERDWPFSFLNWK